MVAYISLLIQKDMLINAHIFDWLSTVTF